MKIVETTQALSLHPIQTIFKVNPTCNCFYRDYIILVSNIDEPETYFQTNNIILTLIAIRHTSLKQRNKQYK